MFRWTSTLSALLFLVGMVSFSFATANHPNAPDSAPQQTVQATIHLTQGLQGVGLFNGAPVHGLIDIQPELPDVHSQHLALLGLTLATPESAAAPGAKPAGLAPETLLRPPRGCAHT
ncbi:MAG: hypothetical protein U1D25_19300 [Hydrogenophaga sp.]|uniref:hypothetical protein n=1 Tax=Hydrogenophaga sp. TaxID=1904254 RepID=UPI00276F08C9|nr:hypothetical protein [Hydrogenophaga sp.]MDP2418146.1 hypothetical protein [Hydrogenophaga sp.]MDZ4190235.1 hypothetical protein [Hydrogenophaga sp.]